jgi:hypothetical protein
MMSANDDKITVNGGLKDLYKVIVVIVTLLTLIISKTSSTSVDETKQRIDSIEMRVNLLSYQIDRLSRKFDKIFSDASNRSERDSHRPVLRDYNFNL